MCYCSFCEKDVSTTVRNREETYPVLGEDTTILATVRFCDECGNALWDPVLDVQNLQESFRVYRKKHNLTQPQFILRRDQINEARKVNQA